MKLLVLSLSYPPDDRPNAYVLSPWLSEFCRRGHEVLVVAAGANWRDGASGGRRAEGVLVRRAPTVQAPPEASAARKALRWLIFQLVGGLRGLAVKDWRPDAILGLTPPPTMGFLASLYRRRWPRAPFLLSIQDVYPLVTVEQGILQEGSFLYTAFSQLVARSYAHVDCAVALTRRSERTLLDYGIRKDKLAVIPNPVDLQQFHPVTRAAGFGAKYQLDGNKFIVMYAGNVGPSFAKGHFLAVASALQKEGCVQLVVAGHGSEMKALREGAERRGLREIVFVPFLEKAELPQLYAWSDIQLVIQKPGVGKVSMPMKLSVAAACKRPVVLVGDGDGSAADFVRSAKCGLVVGDFDPARTVAAIKHLMKSREVGVRCANNGFRHVRSSLAPGQVAQQYEWLIFEKIDGLTRLSGQV